LSKEKAVKYNAVQKRKPALVHPSKDISNLLTLANLIPMSPPIAEPEKQGVKHNSIATVGRFNYRNMILDWEKMLERNQDELNILWRDLQNGLEALPLALQAFLLDDKQGTVNSTSGFSTVNRVDENIQIGLNLAFIRNEEVLLEKIITKATSRIEALIAESAIAKTGELVPEFMADTTPKQLLGRIIQRFIFAFAVQAIFNLLTNREPRENSFYIFTNLHSLATTSQMEINSDGLITFTPSIVIKALDLVDSGRIRKCLRCSKFYWAGRKDMRCCSTRCANNLRMDDYRKRYYTKIKTEEKNYSEKTSTRNKKR
jgi:hypothetical protein